ncbi:MAG: CDP-glucose 4,6-dehydratase [Bacteroidia bacterium]
MGNEAGCLENMVTGELNKFYRDKKIFLTGHTGFKGSWMLAWLTSIGATVKGYALSPLHPEDLYNVIGGDEISASVIADIRDREKLTAEIRDFQPDLVFHLAAQPLVRASYESPAATFEVNTMGTVNVLEAIRGLEKKCSVVIVTTDKVYRNEESGRAYRESDQLGGFDPYSASKAAAEIVCESYRNAFFHPSKYHVHQKAAASARAGNVIGGGDWNQDRIFPDIVKALQKKEKIIVRNPNAVRPWQHVLEPISAYLLLGKKLHESPAAFSSAWNFGPENNDTLSVKEIVELAIKSWGEGAYDCPAMQEQPHEATLLSLDISKAKDELKWMPKYSTPEAVDRTMQWYRQPASARKEFTYLQLNDYRN